MVHPYTYPACTNLFNDHCIYTDPDFDASGCTLTLILVPPVVCKCTPTLIFGASGGTVNTLTLILVPPVVCTLTLILVPPVVCTLTLILAPPVVCTLTLILAPPAVCTLTLILAPPVVCTLTLILVPPVAASVQMWEGQKNLFHVYFQRKN